MSDRLAGTEVFGEVTFNGQALVRDGSAAVPSVAFSGDAASGFYSPASGQLGFSSSGVAAGLVSSSQQWQFPATGSDSAPDVSFGAASNYGIRYGASDLRFIVNGGLRLRLQAVTTLLAGRVSSETEPSITLRNNDAFGVVQKFTASNVDQAMLYVHADINQSGTAGYNALFVDVTETATGSGVRRPVAVKVGGSIVFAVDGDGTVNFGSRTALGSETVTGFITIKDAGGTSRKLAIVS